MGFFTDVVKQFAFRFYSPLDACNQINVWSDY